MVDWVMRRCIGGDGCRAQGAGQGGRKNEKRKKKKEEREKERLSFLGFWLLTTDY
jgi:hypothetical protein